MTSRVLLLALLVGSGCSAERRAQRQENRATQSLGAAAETYWGLMRWEEFGSAAGYLEDREARSAWFLERVSSATRYRSVEVVNVEITPAHEPDDQGRIREGVVSTQVQYYTLPKQILQTEIRAQDWYRVGNDWYLELEDAY